MADEKMDNDRGHMSVEEAGRLGGQRVRELVEEGKEQEGSSRERDRERNSSDVGSNDYDE